MHMVATVLAHPTSLRKSMCVAAMLSISVHLVVLWVIPVSEREGISNAPPLVARIERALEEEPSSPQDAIATEPREEQSPPPSMSAPLASKRQRTPSAPLTPKSKIEPDVRDLQMPAAGVNVPAARDPIYYTARQLDVYPQPLAAINLPYPDSAVAERVDGRLLLSLAIDDFGIVTDVSVVEAQPPGYFEEAARAIFLPMRFAPGIKDGRPVRTRVQIQIRYTYGESAATVR
jgi:protein TonB